MSQEIQPDSVLTNTGMSPKDMPDACSHSSHEIQTDLEHVTVLIGNCILRTVRLVLARTAMEASVLMLPHLVRGRSL